MVCAKSSTSASTRLENLQLQLANFKEHQIQTFASAFVPKMSETQCAQATDDEIALLQSMYPDEVRWDQRSLQLSLKLANGTLELRLSDAYPSKSLPFIIAARGQDGIDIRARANQIVTNQSTGEPCLDTIVIEFIDLVDGLSAGTEAAQEAQQPSSSTARTKTVIIWLHHLLATGKRKLALSQASTISGITKPGYPGVMIFSGPSDLVEAHVQELKQQRWQAFQVRYEADETWSFAHGHGIVEVESMGEVVADIAGSSDQKDAFMQVMKIK